MNSLFSVHYFVFYPIIIALRGKIKILNKSNQKYIISLSGKHTERSSLWNRLRRKNVQKQIMYQCHNLAKNQYVIMVIFRLFILHTDKISTSKIIFDIIMVI